MDAVYKLEAFINELNRRSLENSWCLERAGDVADTVEAYTQAVKDLTPEQQEAVERYIASCEELEFSLVYIAYALGREHEKQGIPSWLPWDLLDNRTR